MANPDKSERSWDLVLLSILVFALLVARACIQSVTIDEADAFTAFATRDSGLMWYPVAQNHLLNTMLERLAWNIFGFNQVAMRLPALLGAAIYLVASIRICSRFAGRLFRLAIFVCLAVNPFVLDYLVAARGYSLAVAFLLAAIAVFFGSVDRALAGEPVSLWRYSLVSVLLALSTAANFPAVDVVLHKRQLHAEIVRSAAAKAFVRWIRRQCNCVRQIQSTSPASFLYSITSLLRFFNQRDAASFRASHSSLSLAHLYAEYCPRPNIELSSLSTLELESAPFPLQ